MKLNSFIISFEQKPTADGDLPLAANDLFTDDSLQVLASNEFDVDCHFQTLTFSALFANSAALLEAESHALWAGSVTRQPNKCSENAIAGSFPTFYTFDDILAQFLLHLVSLKSLNWLS